MDEVIKKANRLAVITQRIGFALWQIQELEGCTAQYLVLITQAKKGMGAKAGNELLGKAFGKTFGSVNPEMNPGHLAEKVFLDPEGGGVSI